MMTLILTVAAIFATLTLIAIAGVTILNVLTFPRLDEAPEPTAFPMVSVLIPARDEAKVIGATVRRLLDQDYPALEVLVLDDGSTDGTAEIARAAATGDNRPHLQVGHGEDTGPSYKEFRVLKGRPLPKGWLGKNWACHQLGQAARGEILLFTDADVVWTPGALRRLVGEMDARGADLQTVWPTQITETRTERLVVPLMAFVIVGYLPLLAVHHIPWPVFSAAMGQCLAFRRDAYERIGGHAAVRDEIVEDVAFAKVIKRAGLRLRVADGGGVICCRMYHGWHEVRNGFAKNVLAGHGDSIAFLLVSWFFHWLLFLLPWFWLALGWLGGPTGWPLWPLALIMLGVGVRALTAAFSRQRIRDAIWLPISTLLMAVIAARSIWWRARFGGPRWKGRVVKRRGS